MHPTPPLYLLLGHDPERVLTEDRFRVPRFTTSKKRCRFPLTGASTPRWMTMSARWSSNWRDVIDTRAAVADGTCGSSDVRIAAR